MYDPLPIGGIAIALMLGTYGLFNPVASIPLLLAAGCGTALVYSVDRWGVHSPEDAINHPKRRRWGKEHRRWLVVEAMLLLVVGSGAVAHLRPATVLAAGGLSLLAGLHLVSVKRWGRPLKAWGMGKPVIVASAWAMGSTLLPVIEAGKGVGSKEIVFTGYRFLFIVPNVLMADWADRAGDAAVGLQTWTTGWTRRKLQVVSTFLLGLGMAGAVGAVYGGFTPLLLIDAFGLSLMLAAVWRVHPGASPRRLFLLDVIVAWPVVVWAVTVLQS